MAEEKKIGKKLREFSLETRLKSSNEFKDKILKMFKTYIKAIVVWGSIIRGDYTGKSDVDIYIIFDDTKMPLKKFDDIREKIDDDIYKMAKSTDPRLHAQPVLALTEFWDGIRACHPLFYNIVREGYAIYDTGFFIPMRKLLEWGKFPATVEAAEQRMEGVPKRIRRVKNIKMLMIAEDLWYAVTDASQSVLMYIGVGPPAPKVLAREIRQHLVEPGMLEEKYAKVIEDIMKFRKQVEHKELKELSGKELDEWIDRVDDFVNRMEKLLHQLEVSKRAADIKKNYEVMIKATVAALKAIDKLPKDPKELPKAFKEHLVDPGLVNPMYGDVFEKVVKMRKSLEDKKISDIPDRDIYMSKEYVRRFLMDVRKVIELKGRVLDKMEQESKAIAKAETVIEKAKEVVKTAAEIEELPKNIINIEAQKKRKKKK